MENLSVDKTEETLINHFFFDDLYGLGEIYAFIS